MPCLGTGWAPGPHGLLPASGGTVEWESGRAEDTVTSGAPGATSPAGRTALPRVLVVIGGLPGAGKTRLLARLLEHAPAEVEGLDSEQVAARLHDVGLRLPYRLLRPVVHVLHRARVHRVLRGRRPVVVLTDPFTSARRRGSVIRSARRAGREIRLVLVDVAPAEALRGQAERRRGLGPRAMARHVRRWRTALAEARASGLLSGVPATVVIRPTARAITLEGLLAD